MQKENHIIIKQGSHYRGVLPGIFYLLSRYAKQGFTLLELLVVVLIIGILTSVAVTHYKKAVAKTEAVQALVSLKTIYDAQKIYYLTTGNYASTFAQLDIGLAGTPNGAAEINLGNGWIISLIYDQVHNSGTQAYCSKGALKGMVFQIYTYRHTSWPKINRYYCLAPNGNDLCEKYFHGIKDGSFGGYNYYYLDKIV